MVGDMCAVTAGECANLDVILRTQRLGLKWEVGICFGAAKAGRLSVLQALYQQPGWHISPRTVEYGAMADMPDVLIWLQKTGIGKWDYSSHMQMMRIAEAHHKLATARWLRAAVR
jgi:hypothetical protein